MPCNSEYMQASNFEKEISKVACFLGEINGVPWQKSWLDGYHPSVYNKVTKEIADEMTEQLCQKMQTTDLKKCSLELQIWWRDHQIADKARCELDISMAKTKQEKEKALSKLTPYEKSLLGVSND